MKSFYNKILILVVSMALITTMSTAYAADEEKNDGLARVVMITAKDGQNKALEDAITKYHHYMGDKKGAWRYQWYSIETGKNTGKYLARSGGHNWADFDAEHSWDKKAGKKFMSDVQPHIANAQVSITKTDSDLGIWPDSIKGYQYFLLTKWHIKSGQNSAFDKGLEKVNAILNDSKWKNYYAIVDTVSGGYGNTRLLVSPKKNFADIAPKDPKFMDVISKSMGKDEAKSFMKEWGQTYKTGSYYMIRHLPKLSDYGDKK